MIEIVITEEMQEKRVDIALSEHTQFSRSMIQKIIYADGITCNDVLVRKPNEVSKLGQIFRINEPKTNIDHIVPEQGTLNILFEDDHIIVLNKNAEDVVHPGAGNASGTLVNFLAHYSNLSDINGTERLGVVHRLDKGVSGCIIFAKTNQAHINISEQFQKRTIEKTYIALCYGSYYGKNFNLSTAGTMEDHMARSAIDRKKMSVIKQDNIIGFMEKDEQPVGKLAVMNYEIQDCKYLNEKFGFITQIKCMPKTGRMHQIRVQLASRKLPIIGDTAYGNKQAPELMKLLGPRIALHSYSVGFMHPITNEHMLIVAELPKEFEAVMLHIQQ